MMTSLCLSGRNRSGEKVRRFFCRRETMSSGMRLLPGILVLALGAPGCGARTAPLLDVADASDVVVLPGCFGAGTTVLATGETLPMAIALDATYVYWATSGRECRGGQIRRAPKAGGPVVTLADDQADPVALVVDATR